MSRIKNFMKAPRKPRQKKNKNEPKLSHEQRFLKAGFRKCVTCLKFTKCTMLPFVLSIFLGVLVSFHYISEGLLFSDYQFTDQSPAMNLMQVEQPKLILLMVDSLRMDYVNTSFHRTDYYTLRQIQLFRELELAQPNNTILLPLTTSMPSYSGAVIESLFTGASPSFSDFYSSIVPSRTHIAKDSILHQLNMRAQPGNHSHQLIFAGEALTAHRLAPEFNLTFAKPPF